MQTLLEALVTDHREASRPLIHHHLEVDTLGSDSCPLVPEAPSQLHPSCLMTHIGNPFSRSLQTNSQVVPCAQRPPGTGAGLEMAGAAEKGTGVAVSCCPLTNVTLLIISTVSLASLQARDI